MIVETTTTAKKLVDDTVTTKVDSNSKQDNLWLGNSRRTDSSCKSSASERWKQLRADMELPAIGPFMTTNMAELERAQKSLREIPYSVTAKLMRSMDTDKGWEDLAGAAGCTMEEILLLKNEQYKGDGSPTRRLLWQLGCQSYKVHDLFEKLKESKRIYEMNILKEYVLKGGQEPKYTSLSCSSSSQSSAQSLESLISQLDLSGPQSQPKMSVSSGYNSSSGSEINFNRHPNVGMSPSKMTGVKVYDDKVIPGAEQSNMYSSTASKFFQEGGQLPNVLRRQAESTAVHPWRFQAQFGSVGTDITLPSSSLSIPPSGTSSNEAAQRLMDQLMGNTTPRRSTSPTPVESQTDEDVAILMKASFTYREISQATQNFCDQNCVGQGAFGTVYYGTLRRQECAIKVLNEAPKHHSERWDQLKKELTPLLTFQHKNIVTLYGYALDGPKVCLVYEFLQHGSLDDRLRQKTNTPPLPWERRLNILVGACQGLNFLHTMGKKPLIHGDIKSANILLDRYLEAKICDLGQADYATSGTDKASLTHITIAESTTKLFGTKAYQAPEIISKSSISIKSDIYSMGVVILEVCSGLLAYDQSRNENKFLVSLFKNQIKERHESEWIDEFRDRSTTTPPSSIFISLLKLADRCVRDVKSHRPGSDKLLEQMDHLYNQFQESAMENEGICNSISTSVGGNPDISSHSNYQSLIEGVPSVGIGSGIGISHSGQSMVSQGGEGVPSTPISVQLQNEKMRGYGFPVSCCDQTSPVSQHPNLQMTPAPSSSSSQPYSMESYLRSEPRRLQEMYDKNPGKRIDKLSVSEETSNQISLDDYIPPSDPRKMQMLMRYDNQNFTPSSKEMVFTTSQMCSEEKMRHPTELNDEVFPKTPCPTAIPFAGSTASDSGSGPGLHMAYNCQSFVQNISSPQTWRESESGSTVKRSSDIDNNAVDMVAGRVAEVKDGEAVQGQSCDKGHLVKDSEGVNKDHPDAQGMCQKGFKILFSYMDQVENYSGTSDDGEG